METCAASGPFAARPMASGKAETRDEAELRFISTALGMVQGWTWSKAADTAFTQTISSFALLREHPITSSLTLTLGLAAMLIVAYNCILERLEARFKR